MKNSEFNSITEKELLEKAQRFCTYQERCSYDVRVKLKKIHATPSQIENVIEKLEKEKYIDDERFSIAYTHGKHQHNQWGKEKIKAGLKLKNISKANIEKAQHCINSTEYTTTLKKLIDKKIKNTSKELLDQKHKQQLIFFLRNKGYHIDDILNALIND